MKHRILFQYYRFLGYCAKHYLKKHDAFTIGINGSVGKTSCRMIMYQTLQKALPHQKIYTSPKNFNGELGMPLSILQVEERKPSFFSMLKVGFFAFLKARFGKKGYDIIILEYGIDRPQEMEFLLAINKPHIGIFTAMDSVHSEQFGDPSAIAKEEAKMVKNTREIAFLNNDDPYAQQLKGTLEIDAFTYQTLINENSDLSFRDIILNVDSKNSDNLLLTSLTIQIKKQTFKVQTNLFGKANYGYLAVALVVADLLVLRYNKTELDMKSFLKEALIYRLQAGRCSLFLGKHQSLIVDSTYNASPLSMRKLIDTTLVIQKSCKEKRKILLVLGDMRELGDFTEQEHRLLAAYVQQTADYLVTVGESMKNYMLDELEKIGFSQKQMQYFDNARQAGEWLLSFLKKSDDQRILLFKGSQNTIFLEEAVKMILKNPQDAQFLARQSTRWQKKKEHYFSL